MESLEVGYWDDALSGNIYNIIFKICIFGISFLFTLLFLGLIIEKFEEVNAKLKRKRNIRVYKDYIKSNTTPLEELRFNLYLDKNFIALNTTHILLKAINRGIDPLDKKVIFHLESTTHSPTETAKKSIKDVLSILIEHNIIELVDEKYKITEQNRNRLSQFITFITKHNKSYEDIINGVKVHIKEISTDAS